MNRLKASAATLVTCMALLASMPVSAFAAGGGQGSTAGSSTGQASTATTANRAGIEQVRGTVSDSSPNSLTVKTPTGDFVAVQLTDQTRYILNGKSQPERPAIEVGEAVRVVAHKEQDGSLTARVVALNDKAGHKADHVAGTISDFNASQITIKTKTGDFVALQLTADTKYIVDGKRVDQRPDFHNGERVGATYRKENDGSLTALTVAVGTATAVAGTISDFSPQSITIKTKTGDFTAVQTNADTKYRLDGKPVDGRPDLHDGERISATVRKEQDGSLTALVVSVNDKAAQKPDRVAGTISDFNDHQITVKTGTGDFVSVQLTSDTRFYVDGKLQTSRPDMHAGERIHVAAHKETDGSLTALVVTLQTT